MTNQAHGAIIYLLRNAVPIIGTGGMRLKEIRLHGRGGQGVVKASQMVVKAAVEGGLHGQFIPFFGVERKGSPVFGYLRLSTEEIRRKT